MDDTARGCLCRHFVLKEQIMNIQLDPAIAAQLAEVKRLLASVARLPKMPAKLYAPRLTF